MVPLGLTAATSILNAAIQKTFFWLRKININIFKWRLEWYHENVKSLEDTVLLRKGVIETVENKIKEQRRGFLSMLTATFGAILFGNLLAGKEVARGGDGVIRSGEGVIRPGERQDF